MLIPFAVQTPIPLTTEPEAVSSLGQAFPVELSRKGNVTNLSNSALAPGLPANSNMHAPSVPDSLSSDTRGGACGTAVLDDGIGAGRCEEIVVLVNGMEDVGTGIRLVRVGRIVGIISRGDITVADGDLTARGDA